MEQQIQFQGPFRIITTLGSRVILPPSYTEWLKNCPDLSHQALVEHVSCKKTLINQSSSRGLSSWYLTLSAAGIFHSVSRNGRSQSRERSEANLH